MFYCRSFKYSKRGNQHFVTKQYCNKSLINNSMTLCIYKWIWEKSMICSVITLVMYNKPNANLSRNSMDIFSLAKIISNKLWNIVKLNIINAFWRPVFHKFQKDQLWLYWTTRHVNIVFSCACVYTASQNRLDTARIRQRHHDILETNFLLAPEYNIYCRII